MAKQKEPIMKGNPVLLRADGTQEEVKPANGKKFELKELKTFVDGTVTIAHLDSRVRFCAFHPHEKPSNAPTVTCSRTSTDSHVIVLEASYCGEQLETVEIDPKANDLMIRHGWVMALNENGFNENLPRNKEASRLYGGIMVGDVVLCRFDATPWHGIRGFRFIYR